MADDFGAKLGLVLKALTISNGRLAASLGVDKSLVGRWTGGTVRPSAHNLARLTAHLAETLPGLTLLDWERPLDALRLLVDRRAAPDDAPRPTPSAIADWLARPRVAEVAAATAIDGMGVTGFWRSTRPAPDLPGRFCHDYSIIEPGVGGPLRCRSGVFSARLTGWAIVVADQLYTVLSSDGLGSMNFAILNRVRHARVDAMDGVSIACAAVAGGVPMALAYYTERVGDLSPDAAENEIRFAALLAEHPLAAEGSVPEALQRHLLRDIGPAARRAGGDLFLTMPAMASLARGHSPTEGKPRLRAVAG